MTAPLWSGDSVQDASEANTLAHMEWCQVWETGIGTGVSTQANKQQLIHGYPGIEWEEGTPVDPDPPADPTALGGGSGAKKYRKSKYPRRVLIDGVLHWVNSAEEERALLEAYRDRLEAEALELALEDAPPAEVRKAKVRVVRAQRRVDEVDDRATAWLERLRREDEEILTVLLH